MEERERLRDAKGLYDVPGVTFTELVHVNNYEKNIFLCLMFLTRVLNILH